MKRFQLKKKILYITITAYVLFFSWLVWDQREFLGFLTRELTTLLLIAIVLSLLANGMINYYLFRSSVPNLLIRDGIRLAVLNNIGNYLPLSFGLVGKGIYLKKFFGLDYVNYAVLSFSMLAIHTSISGLTGMVAIYQLGIKNLELYLMFMALIAIWVVLFVPLPEKVQDRIGLRHKNTIKTTLFTNGVQLFLWQAVYILFQSIVLLITFFMVGKSLSFWQVLFYASGLTLTRFVNILPGALGIREAIIVTLGLYTGLNFKIALLGIGLVRIAVIIVVFVMGYLLYADELRKWFRKHP